MTEPTTLHAASPRHPLCVLCGHEVVEREMRVGGYDLLRCRRCQLTFAHPFSAPPRLYEAAYEEAGTYGGYARVQIAQLKAGRIRCGWAQRQFLRLPLQLGRLLDVGCGSGAFMMAAKRAGWRPAGIDVSRTAVEMVRQELELDVKVGMTETLEFPNGGFEAVTAWELLEHLHAPVRFVGEVHRVLRREGVFAMSTPDWESRWPRTTWKGIAASFPPVHVTFWSRHSLRWLLEHAGFVDIQVRRKPWAGFYELGTRTRLARLPAVLLRSLLLREGGGQLFAAARVAA